MNLHRIDLGSYIPQPPGDLGRPGRKVNEPGDEAVSQAAAPPVEQPHSRPLPHYWETLGCAGRAAEGLRAGWRRQLQHVRKQIGYSYIRFHGLFHEEMMVYREDAVGNPVYNFQYLDELFDYLLSVGIRPFLELGFMPPELASGDATCFFWKGNITPPADYDKWAALVDRTVRHCIGRYGAREVRRWYFEVWNEPNLYQYFWRGTQAEYFRLYEVTVRTIKNIDPELAVGGPSTSNFVQGEAPWVRDFLSFCRKQDLPVDFVSSHPYPAKWPTDKETGENVLIYRDPDSTASDCTWLRQAVTGEGFPNAEIHITEWNSSFLPWDLLHDTAFMGPFIVHNVLAARGLVDSLGFWTFTDIFEETRAGSHPFHGGFGLVNYQGIPKPSFHAFAFLHRLGTEVLGETVLGEVPQIDRPPDVLAQTAPKDRPPDEPTQTGTADRPPNRTTNPAANRTGWILTRRDNDLVLLAWNYLHYAQWYAQGGLQRLDRHDRYSAFGQAELLKLEVRLPETVAPAGAAGWIGPAGPADPAGAAGFMDGTDEAGSVGPVAGTDTEWTSAARARRYRVKVIRVDRTAGSAFDAWMDMGAPDEFDADVVQYLTARAQPDLRVETMAAGDTVHLEVPPHGIQLVEIRPERGDNP